jgi:hypothetical protein
MNETEASAMIITRDVHCTVLYSFWMINLTGLLIIFTESRKRLHFLINNNLYIRLKYTVYLICLIFDGQKT